jgi:hypothetical protein
MYAEDALAGIIIVPENATARSTVALSAGFRNAGQHSRLLTGVKSDPYTFLAFGWLPDAHTLSSAD